MINTLVTYILLVTIIIVGFKEWIYRKLVSNKQKIINYIKTHRRDAMEGNFYESAKALKYEKKFRKLETLSFERRGYHQLWEPEVDITGTNKIPKYYQRNDFLHRTKIGLKSVFSIKNFNNIKQSSILPQTPWVAILSWLGLSFVPYGNSIYFQRMIVAFIPFVVLATLLWYYDSNKIVAGISRFIGIFSPLVAYLSQMTYSFQHIGFKKYAVNQATSSFITNVSMVITYVFVTYLILSLVLVLTQIIFKKQIKFINLEFFFIALYVLLMTM